MRAVSNVAICAVGLLSCGWSDRPDGKSVSFSDCEKGDLGFGADVGHRIAFDSIDTTFVSNGVKLVGRLVMPIREEAGLHR